MSTEKVSFKRGYEGYNDKLELISNEVPVEFDVFSKDTPLEEVMSKLNELNRWTDALNYLLRNEALKDAKKRAGVSGTINRAVLMEFIKPYRELPDFAKYITSEDKRKATSEEWNAQTNAILNQIKNVPFIMDSIRTKSALANETDE